MTSMSPISVEPATAGVLPAKVSVTGLSKLFGGEQTSEVVALKAIDLSVQKGEFIALLGPSGCGKTTLLRIMAGLETASAGSIRIDDKPVVRPPLGVSFVFQTSVLLPWRTILSNVLLPVEIEGRVTAEWTQRALKLLQTVGLADFANHRPAQLSGGMRQRAAICRALLTDPDLLLMDEPFGALDAMTRDTMNEEVLQLWRSIGMTVVFVTHDIAEAVRLATRIVVMSPRPGRIEKVIETGFTAADTYADRVNSQRFADLVKLLRSMFQHEGAP
jgi:NitT/TauT family transport system ATP-binding protein